MIVNNTHLQELTNIDKYSSPIIYSNRREMDIQRLERSIASKYELKSLHIPIELLTQYTSQQLEDMFINNTSNQFTPFPFELLSQDQKFQFQKNGDVWFVFNKSSKGHMTMVSPYKMSGGKRPMIYCGSDGEYIMINSNIYYTEIEFRQNFFVTQPEYTQFNQDITFGDDYQMEEDSQDDDSENDSDDSDDSYYDDGMSEDESSYDDDNEINGSPSSSYSDEMSEDDEKKIVLAFGVSDHTNIKAKNYVGWESGTYGFHTDDGSIFFGFSFTSTEVVTQKIQYGDVIGCGYIPSQNTVFFTYNGNLVAKRDYQSSESYFALTLKKIEGFEINSGLKQFRYNPFNSLPTAY